MSALRSLGKIVLAFAFMVAFLEAVIAAAKWWHGEALTWWEWGLAGALPILIGIWLRYFSIFGCSGGECLKPPQDAQR